MNQNQKYKKLLLGVLFDAMGFVSFLIPGIGEFTDIIWAPISAWLMTKLYKGNIGKIAAGINFLEEAMPGLDVIPSFTLMWLYTYVIKNEEEEEVIDLK